MRDLFVVVPPGLEEPAEAELRALGASGLRGVNGGVSCQGDLAVLVRLNLAARVASRVLLRLAEGSAARPDDVARAAALRTVIPPAAEVRLDVQGAGVRPQPIRKALEDALRAAVPDARVRSGGGEDLEASSSSPVDLLPAKQARLLARVSGGRLELSADASGEHLHRRGYRQETGAAPLRENLAAGILALAGYTGDTPLVDPMCGSGTFPIEAALLALRRAPGLGRRFAAEGFPIVPPELWERERAALLAAERASPPAAIVGRDEKAGFLGVSRRNADKAGVLRHLVLERVDATEGAPPPGPPGLVVANPPYGKRVGDDRELATLYRRFGGALRARFAGWSVALLIPDEPRLEKHLALPSPRVVPLQNGGLPCRLLLAKLGPG